MLTLQKIKSLLHLKKQNISYEKEDTKLFRDWQHMLISELIFLCLAGLIAFYFYIAVSQGKLFITPDDTSEVKVTINNTLLTKVVEDIKTRAVSTETLKNNKNLPPDPSL